MPGRGKSKKEFLWPMFSSGKNSWGWCFPVGKIPEADVFQWKKFPRLMFSSGQKFPSFTIHYFNTYIYIHLILLWENVLYTPWVICVAKQTHSMECNIIYLCRRAVSYSGHIVCLNVPVILIGYFFCIDGVFVYI